MKRSLVKLVSLTYLFAATHMMTISCSSSDEGTGEEVVSEEGNESANAEGEGENANANNEEGNNNNTNNEEGGNNNLANNEGGNAAGGNEFGNGAEGGNATAGAEGGNAAPASDDNLSQIIEEMNQTNPAAAAAPEGGFDNLAANAGGNVAAPAAAEAPAAEAPAPASAPAATGAPVAPGLPELGSKMAYIVQKGDTLGKIAQRVYGDTNKWTEIADFTGIANPKLIYPGDVVYYQLTERTTAFAGAYEGIGRSEVEVGQGDTLATIAGKVFGNTSLWKLIWRQNDKIDNPDRLTAGTKIYYIDHSKMADVYQEVENKVAAMKASKVKEEKVSANKTVKSAKLKSSAKVKVEPKNSKTLDVANDEVVDQFSHVNAHNLVARLI